ncbi:MAG: histone deacetylase [Nitrospirae bacterium]|nr:MAG: histone deacetylase [Nitrospirota bacterium]
MRRVGLIYDDIYLKHEMPAGHPESKLRLISILEALKSSPYWNYIHCLKPRKAGLDEIATVHKKSYIERMRDFGTGYFDPDTYVSEHTLEAAFFAAGAVVEAVERCRSGELERAFCAVRPPGHHAEADRAMGFCVFNNVAVGARHAQKIGYEKIFIVDFDVHHGNGTQHMFEEDDSVFYFSTHQYPHYPGTGSGSEKGRGKGLGYTYNVPMGHGAGDNEFEDIYNRTLPALIKKFSPDMVMVSSGYDIHRRDPLSGLSVSNEGIRSIVRGILSSADVPFVFTLEGGYDLTALAESVRITVGELLGA